MRPTSRHFLKHQIDGPDFRITMLTVPDQQTTSERPLLRQSDVALELMPGDSSPILPLSLLLGVPPTHAAGDPTRQS
jgi:hypothetical protein